MDTTDLVELLRRLARQWADDNRASPELEVILDVFDEGGKSTVDLAVLEPDPRQRERLRSRLARLGHLGVLYMPEAGSQLAQVQLAARPRSASRARIATRTRDAGDDPRARDAGDDPRARDAGAQLRAPGCSVLRTGSVLSSLLSAHSARVPLRACEGDKTMWAQRGTRVLELLGVEILEPHFPAWVDAVYSACEYLTGWESLVAVIDQALAQKLNQGWKGWPHLMRAKGPTGPMEYLTRRTFLELGRSDVKKNTSGGLTSVIFDTVDEKSWEESATKDERLRSLRAWFEKERDQGVWSAWLASCHWSVEGNEAIAVAPDPDHVEWITENYLPELERGASSSGLTFTLRPPGAR